MLLKKNFFAIFSVIFMIALESKAVAENWGILFEKMRISENSMTDSMGNTRRYIAKITPNDVAINHSALYLVGRGMLASNNYFVVRDASVVFEGWSINKEDDWLIDQWIFSTTIEGYIKRVSRFNIVRTRGGTIKEHKSVPSGTPEEQRRHLDSLILSW